MRLIYYGTPALAVPPLSRLVSEDRAPLLVVTRADRPRGRGMKTGKSSVKEAAESMGLPVATPARAGAPDELTRIRALSPDLLIVTAYGQLLPKPLLEIPRLGALNVHFSLLPRHRGASPVQAAILAGDKETGVTTMWMTEGLDEGPIFLSRSTPIDQEEDAGTLGSRLALLGAECLAESIARIERGDAARREQDPAGATYAGKIAPDAGRLTLDRSAGELVRRVRAFTPDPGAYVPLGAERLAVLSAEADAGTDADADAPQGTVIALDRVKGIRIALAEGSIWLRRVRPSGRREMSGFDFANGARLRPGALLTRSEASK
ncbi:MAG: methionyl-tRNA formyltransferase [Candidatus Eisenbacteria bacterium]|uniref:Methionyl-tRNA formyltransferase n=1 Tax=Eiseniibacteriota bacterium TaxID=2212470 RepID=A0A538TMD7_UNCEI|nr:MAG: methionyl-tRNA formyltransferase [Candidatus Eisenbacteria bacterium]